MQLRKTYRPYPLWKITKNYKKYGPEKIRQFMQTMQDEGPTFPKAAARCMIPQKFAYRFFREFSASSGTVPPSSAPKAKTELQNKNRSLSIRIF